MPALVVEEELLPGSRTAIPEPGRNHYPAWHGPFNRHDGLAEAVVPGSEDAFHEAFLRASAGPAGLAAEAERAYLDAYRPLPKLTAGVGYYRTPDADSAAVAARARRRLPQPVLAIGGEFAMGTAVATGLREVAAGVEELLIPGAGHYPAEQQPTLVTPWLIGFLEEHHSDSP